MEDGRRSWAKKFVEWKKKKAEDKTQVLGVIFIEMRRVEDEGCLRSWPRATNGREGEERRMAGFFEKVTNMF